MYILFPGILREGEREGLAANSTAGSEMVPLTLRLTNEKEPPRDLGGGSDRGASIYEAQRRSRFGVSEEEARWWVSGAEWPEGLWGGQEARSWRPADHTGECGFYSKPPKNH